MRTLFLDERRCYLASAMRTTSIFVATSLSLLLALPAGAQALPRLELTSALLTAAQDDVLDDEDTADEPASPEVRPGGQDIGETVGGAIGFERPLGFFTSSDLGGFIRFGGYTSGEECGAPDRNCKPRITSNLQPYIGLAVGYDVLDFLAVQLSFGTGFVANAAPIENTPGSPRDYGITFMNLTVLGSYYFDRFGIVAKVFGGGSFLNPAPLPDAPFIGGNAGGGLGIRYATLLTDVTVGFDVNGYAVFVPDGGGMLVVPGMSFAPVIQYTF